MHVLVLMSGCDPPNPKLGMVRAVLMLFCGCILCFRAVEMGELEQTIDSIHRCIAMLRCLRFHSVPSSRAYTRDHSNKITQWLSHYIQYLICQCLFP